MSNSTVEGVLLRLIEPKEGANTDLGTIPTHPTLPNIQKTYTAVADDGEKPSRLVLHVVSDISPLLSSPEFFEEDVKANPNVTLSWIVCGFINGRDAGAPETDDPSTVHPLSYEPALNSKIVINGGTPRPEKEHDYHDWYNQEHGTALAGVPGWNAGRRYSLQKSYGEIETANFYGFNYYDEDSGLGGPIWQKNTKTEWTYRIRGNAARPNIRRVWKVQKF